MIDPVGLSRNIDDYISTAKILFQKHSQLLKWKSEPESILDLGIGDGRMTKEVILPILPKNIKEYVGVDISETMLASARECISHNKFKTQTMDAVTNSVPAHLKNRFHHIFSNNLFHFMRDMR